MQSQGVPEHHKCAPQKGKASINEHPFTNFSGKEKHVAQGRSYSKLDEQNYFLPRFNKDESILRPNPQTSIFYTRKSSTTACRLDYLWPTEDIYPACLVFLLSLHILQIAAD